MPSLLTLPSSRRDGAPGLARTLALRRTVRDFAAGRPLDLWEVGQLLWAAQGITDGNGRRTAPSAGACYPLRVYAVAGEVTDLPTGAYAYEPARHALTLRSAGDHRLGLSQAAIGDQPWVGSAATVIAISANMASMNAQFAGQQSDGRRGARYACLEAGAASQNIHLQATGLGLGMVLVGGFDNAAADAALQLPPHEETLMLACVGRP